MLHKRDSVWRLTLAAGKNSQRNHGRQTKKKERMIMKKVRIGLLGAGRIGKLHGENLAHAVPSADLYAVADPFMNDATREWAASMGIEK